jgi:hypothetical protein
MRQGVRIRTDRRRDADCIAGALHEYGSEVKRAGRRWAIHVSVTSAPDELTAVLAALKICLDENAIAMVKVEIDGQAYAMEGMV